AIQAAIATRVAGGAPAGVADDRWRHAKLLYKSFGNRSLWLDKEGVHDKRAISLLKALIDAHTDALRLDSYPLAQLTSTIAATKAKHPTAQQLAEADVLLTAAYASLGEDLYSGQVNPKAVSN